MLFLVLNSILATLWAHESDLATLIQISENISMQFITESALELLQHLFCLQVCYFYISLTNVGAVRNA